MIIYFYCIFFFFFFFNDTATTEIYTLSLHDALLISRGNRRCDAARGGEPGRTSVPRRAGREGGDERVIGVQRPVLAGALEHPEREQELLRSEERRVGKEC